MRALFLLPIIAVAFLGAQRADAQSVFTGEWAVAAPLPGRPQLPLRRVVVQPKLSAGSFDVTFYHACSAPHPGLCAMGPITLAIAHSLPQSISGFGSPRAAPGSPTCRVVVTIVQTTIDDNPASKVTPDRLKLSMRRGRTCAALPPYEFERTVVYLTRSLPHIDPRHLPGG